MERRQQERSSKRTRQGQGQCPGESRVGEDPEEVTEAGEGSGIPEAERSREKPRGVQDSVPGPCKEGLITNTKLQWLREGEAMEALNKEPVSKNFDAGEGSSVTAGGQDQGALSGFSPLHLMCLIIS